ncbi:MAG: hypothetical protein M3Z06_05005 [Actinomycetota bacterium]|nr:hypothetical protein [Actinomycetota bacterium]
MNRLARLAPGIALAAALALALAGCGSSPLTTSALRARATRVCRLAGARADRIPNPTIPVQGVTFLRRGMAVLQPELSALVKLRPGGPAAQVYATALQAFRRELTMVKATAESLRRDADPVIAVKTLQRQIAPLEAQANAAWDRLEIPACRA